jgi:flagellar hook assembly protein FlgD
MRLDLPRGMPLHLGVFDVDGRLVRTLVDGRLEAGSHSLSWDGADVSGVRLNSGVYFLVLRAGEDRISRRLLLVR